MIDGEVIDGDSPKGRKITGEWKSDLTAVIQCCHSLRAGATLEERTEPSSTRRRKFEHKGVGGFTYHVLKLPHGHARVPIEAGDTHASPRLHVRRSHIRKLPTGVLTFVRQCLVGTAQDGFVHKSYRVERRGQPAPH